MAVYEMVAAESLQTPLTLLSNGNMVRVVENHEYSKVSFAFWKAIF